MVEIVDEINSRLYNPIKQYSFKYIVKDSALNGYILLSEKYGGGITKIENEIRQGLARRGLVNAAMKNKPGIYFGY